MESDLDLEIVFDNGFIFLKLIECLNNSENALIEFKPNSIKYNELVNKQVEGKKSYLTINNTFEIYASKLSRYYYGMKSPEYNMYFNVNDLKEKIKDCKPRDKIKMYKTKYEDLIYMQNIKPDDVICSVSFYKPLNMQNQDFIIYSKSLRDDDNPNFVVDPKILKENCSKVKPTVYKKVKLSCHCSYMIAEAITPDGSNGNIFPYGKPTSKNPTNVDYSKININFDLDNLINQGFNNIKAVKANIDNNTSFDINIPTSAFKGLGKLCSLSKDPIKVFIEDGYIKILTQVGDFGNIRTYIGNDSTI